VARLERGKRRGIAGVIDVGHAAAGRAAEVRVRARRGLVHRGPFARDIQFEDQAELVEPGQAAVDRGEADPRPPLAGAMENVDGRGMAARAVFGDDV
jgi:hypothetical protein